LKKGHSASFAYDLFIEAISYYEQAEALRPANVDDPILRRNSCLRTLWAEGLQPMHQSDEPPLE
jgi:hypothetical protein